MVKSCPFLCCGAAWLVSPALLQEEHSVQSLVAWSQPREEKQLHSDLIFITNCIRQQSQQQSKARRPLRSRGRTLRFPLWLFRSRQGPGSAPSELQNPPSRGTGLPLREPRLSCPAVTAGFPGWGSPKLGADPEGTDKALVKFTGKISASNSAIWDGECLKKSCPREAQPEPWPRLQQPLSAVALS